MNDNMDDVSFRKFLQDAFARANEVMRAGAVFYIWHADSEGYNFRGACKDVGWQVRECLIWNKSSLVLGRQDYQWKHEPCLYGWKDGAPHLWASDRKQTTVLDFDKPLASKLHPTMKPVALFAYQIGNNTHEGDAVLDLFGGSGTTLIACEQLGRRAFTSELDPKYCDVIVKRYINLKGSEDGVFVLREGTKIPYSEIKKDN
jgi:site-specific DNA-methyltransferase (adenine-specific)